MKKLVFILLTFVSPIQLAFSQTDAHVTESGVGKTFNPGFINISEFNAGFGIGETNADYAKHFFGLTSIFGFCIKENLQTGIGTGLLFYNGGMLVPLYVDLRYKINFEKMAVYAFGDGGMLFNFSNKDLENKIFLNPGIGIQFTLRDNLFANLGAGLFMQTTKEKEHDSFISLKLGVTYAFRK